MKDKRIPEYRSERLDVVVRPSDTVEEKWTYANHVMVSQSPHDFRIIFCDATPLPDSAARLDGGGISPFSTRTGRTCICAG